jgi:hypothetical protein
MVQVPYADPGRASFEVVAEFTALNLLSGTHPELAPAFGMPLRVNTTFPQFAVLGLAPDGALDWATEGNDAGIRASGALTFSGVGTAADTVIVGDRTYTLRAAVAAADDVLIGGTAAATALNLLAAINGGDGEGVEYGTDTVPHQEVTGRSNAAAVVGLVANEAGVAGNTIATTEVGTGASFGAVTLLGGLDTGGIKAAYVLAHAASLGATGSGNGQCWYSGCFNPDALVWDDSFQTAAQKAAAFRGAPTPTNIIIAARG